MIDQDFNDFDPRIHHWVVLNFGGRKTKVVAGQVMFDHIFDELVEVILDAKEDFFTAAHNLKHEIQASQFSKVFEAKPGLFGFSIDLYHAGSLLQKIYGRMRGIKNNG